MMVSMSDSNGRYSSTTDFPRIHAIREEIGQDLYTQTGVRWFVSARIDDTRVQFFAGYGPFTRVLENVLIGDLEASQVLTEEWAKGVAQDWNAHA